jgi:glycosyltransferase involved in cell wall biosynthesis
MKPLKVLMLNRGFSLTGGVPHVLLTFARHHARQRLELHMGSFRPFAPAMAEALAAAGTAMHELGDTGYLGPTLALRKIIKDQAIDVVVATSLKTYMVAKFAATPGCKVLYWIHGLAMADSSPAKIAAYRLVARHDTLIFVARLVQQTLSFPGHKGREVVVLNGVEDVFCSDPPYDRSGLDALGIPRSAFVVGYTASFVALKEHKTLLAAFSQLTKVLQDLHLVFIGTGELWESTKVLARKIPESDHIHFLGPRADARKLLGVMDAYVHPSNGEGLSLAVIEAMMAKQAIVVADSGALPEIIDDGATGLMCRALDATDLASKILILAKDPEMRLRLGEKARQVALERFGVDHFVEQLTLVLESDSAACRAINKG